MGKPLTKTTVIELANSLVSGTEYESKISDCKNLRKLNQSQKLGSAWYKGFLKRYSDDLSRSGSVIKDIKWRTWVTHDNFENMYENVYKTMVEAGIAKEVDKFIVHENGLKSKYILTHPEYWQVADASSLNGAYKIELVKAKRQYLEHRNQPKFEPTDIVPLINMAFEKSFGNQKNAVKAIADRGWNPLNYNILTIILDKKNDDVVDLTVGNSENIALPKVNVEAGIGSYYLDHLIEEENKSLGRKRKFEEIKNEQKSKEQKIEYLKKLTKVSSATLAANNHYTLDDNVLQLVMEKQQAEEDAQKAVEMRKRVAEAKRAEALKNALTKFSACPNGLTVPELKVLVAATTTASESPAKNKKGDLTAQLYREPRYSRVQALSNDLRLTLAAEAGTTAVEALLALTTTSTAPTNNPVLDPPVIMNSMDAS
jgi:hypothetical protein